MKYLFFLIFLVLLQNCSFDDKSGIWKNNSKVLKKSESLKDFEILTTKNSSFDQIVQFKKDFKFQLKSPTINSSWTDIFYDETNNLKNFDYIGLNQLILESVKITKPKNNNSILWEKNNLITSDKKGNIFIYSLKKNKVINKFNFYKKKYKKVNKILNLIINDDVIYISDNIGYLYALNYVENKILWAKNYKVPFRSNIKLVGNKIILSNHNNDLIFINKDNGNMIKLIPTEDTIVKNQFINNLSLNRNSVFFINTYGSLYSIDIKSMQVNWFINLNQSNDLNPSNLFFGSKIINSGNKLAVSSNHSTYIIDSNNGTILNTFNFSTKITPIIIENYFFLITKNDLIVAINLQDENIIFSYDINEKISKFLEIKKDKAEFKALYIANNSIYIILKNSFFLKFSVQGDLESIRKLPKKIHSDPIFIDGKMLYINSSGRLSILN